MFLIHYQCRVGNVRNNNQLYVYEINYTFIKNYYKNYYKTFFLL